MTRAEIAVVAPDEFINLIVWRGRNNRQLNHPGDGFHILVAVNTFCFLLSPRYPSEIIVSSFDNKNYVVPTITL